MPAGRLVSFALGLMICLALALRLVHLDTKSLWSDEVCTVATALGHSVDPNAWAMFGEDFDPPRPQPAQLYKQRAWESTGFLNLWQINQVLEQNVHPPLFFGLMNLSIHTLGDTPGMLRLPSVLLGVFCVPLLFLLARWLAFGNARQNSDQQDGDHYATKISENAFAAAVFAAGMLALSGYQIAHSQDARPYMLQQFLALLALCILLQKLMPLAGAPLSGKQPAQQLLLKHTWLWWLSLGLVCLAGLYTQYLFVGFIVFVAVLALCLGKQQEGSQKLPGFALVLAILLIGLLPWWPVFQAQKAFMHFAGHYTDGLWQPLTLPEKLFRTFCDFIGPQSQWIRVWVLGLLGVSALGFWRQKYSPLKIPLLWVSGLWIAVLVLFMAGLDVLKDSHMLTIRRYTLLASPAVYLLLSGLWAYGLPGVFRRALWAKSLQGVFALALLGLMLVNARDVLAGRKLASENYRAAASIINTQATPTDWVWVNKTGANTVGLAYYLKPATLMQGLDVGSLVTGEDQHLLETMLSRSFIQTFPAQNAPRRMWLVFSHEAPSARKAIIHWLEAQGFVQTQQWQNISGIRLLLMTRG